MQTAIIDRSKVWTVEDLLELEESSLPCELIDGELFRSPCPEIMHQIVLSNLYDIIKAFTLKVGGLVLFAPVDVHLDNKNVFQPDLLFISSERKNILQSRGLNAAPDLAVEIISPSNSFKDRNQKKRLYQKFGVKEFWIIDPGNRTIEIYDFVSGENPILYLAGEGTVTSKLLSELSFQFEDIFKIS